MECKYVFDDKKVNKFSCSSRFAFSITWLSWIHFPVKAASHNLSFTVNSWEETKGKQHHLAVDSDLENCWNSKDLD